MDGGRRRGVPGPKPLLIATRSVHKIAEIRRMGANWDLAFFRPVSLDDALVPRSPAEDNLEPFDTFEKNARSKARHFATVSGLPTVADDSGLEVDELGGRPGVRSRRFAPAHEYPTLGPDEANNRHLLACLEGVPESRRGARYVCVVWFVDPESGQEAHFRGEAPGRVVKHPVGSGGFGYDPLFLDVDAGRTYAELSPREKDERSHRGRAFRELTRFLSRSFAPPQP